VGESERQRRKAKTKERKRETKTFLFEELEWAGGWFGGLMSAACRGSDWARLVVALGGTGPRLAGRRRGSAEGRGQVAVCVQG